ncbi:MAG: hypothetical protein K1X78_08425 [Verrucomicrobiaceae bacterium]|nr:hypothetical protein [Verrucomicrobiaceae bacterium]
MEDRALVAEIFNLGEAALWFAIAAVIAWKRRGREELARIHRCVPPAFFVFSISDLVESQTGAFWEPWWLLAMKAGCVVALVLAGNDSGVCAAHGIGVFDVRVFSAVISAGNTFLPIDVMMRPLASAQKRLLM